ncbi:ferrichrome ABC transporter substrate-binding protein [Paenibacillus montaniterrae]|uniref:Ferrichrome ABC transporter substrate-binding protein n=1 Tax=Paenibacillus montaniterrae TaxID=429341 RepID=A0A919YSJ7_9BACL|nr:ABC transporter substrate-binding protein [Paenibacillus montaniterrae]GIP16526.1 ferrichrome ABC transporter substrate-binding protein [Paenibacillus montaniterrae]
MFVTRKSIYMVCCLMLMLSLLAACGGNSSNGQNGGNEPNQATNESDPAGNTQSGQNGADETVAEGGAEATERTLTDPLGHTVTIPAQPQRIIASYLEDYLVALGVKPAAQWSVSDSPMRYLQYELADVPIVPHDLPYEVVTGHNPDLIIIGDESLIANDKYDGYNKIAPTYALGAEINADWRKALLEVGNVLGKDAEAEAVLADYEAKAAAAKEQLAASGETPSAAAIWLVGGSFWMVSEGESSGAVLYSDLGFAVPKLVETISQGEGGIWKSVSLEALAELDADHIFLVNSDAASGSASLNDPVWQSIKAVKNGNLHEFGPEKSWLYTGPIANSQIIDDVLASLGL